MPLVEPLNLPDLRQLRPTKKGEPVHTIGYTPTIIGEWDNLQSAIRDTLSAANIAEEKSQNAGLIRAQCELLLATHRCAQALEQTNRELNDLCRLVRSWLQPPRQGA